MDRRAGWSTEALCEQCLSRMPDALQCLAVWTDQCCAAWTERWSGTCRFQCGVEGYALHQRRFCPKIPVAVAPALLVGALLA
jgi:hypothetical protein